MALSPCLPCLWACCALLWSQLLFRRCLQGFFLSVDRATGDREEAGGASWTLLSLGQKQIRRLLRSVLGTAQGEVCVFLLPP